jgi:hypothetical protein
VLVESGLISLDFGELDAHSVVVGLQNSDAHFSLLLLVTLVLGLQGELGFVFLGVDYWFDIFFLSQVLVEGLFDHVWVISGEELGIVGEELLVLLKGFLWLFILLFGLLSFGACTSHNLAPSLFDSFVLLSLLLHLFGLDVGLDGMVSLVELRLDLRGSGHWALHPGMSQDFRHGRSVGGLQLKHALDEVLELFTEVPLFAWLVLAMGSPEYVSSISCQASVEWIIWLSCGERWMLSNQNK